MNTTPLRIALVSPKGPLYHHRSGIFRKTLRPAPLTFSTLAALIPEDVPATVQVYDEGIEDVNPDRIDADLVGLTATTGSAPRAYEMARSWRARGIPVVMGGPHATLVPEDAAPHVDTVVTGYAEQTWPQLLRDVRDGALKPRYTQDPALSFADPANLPFARREVMTKSGYRSLATFEATRGCVHACNFCVVPAAWGRKPLQKPIDHIVEDIQRVGQKRILFYDLNIIADRAYARDLFDALAPLNVEWFGLATSLIGRDHDLMERLARSGCRGLLIGFEGVDAASLASHKKRFNDPTDYTALVGDLQRLGVWLNGTFVFGGDGDTEHSFDAVIDFVESHRLELPRFSILTPFPGTGLFDSLDRQGRLLHKDWADYDGQHVVFQPKNMTPAQLQAGAERVWKQVYSMRSIMRRIGGRKRGAAMLGAVNLAYRFYAYRLHRYYNCQVGLAS